MHIHASNTLASVLLLPATIVNGHLSEPLGSQQSVPYNISEKCKSSTFEPILPAGAVVLFTTSISANGTFNEDLQPGETVGSPSLPALCAAKFTLPSSEDTSIDVAIFLPEVWNQRFMATGNGGFGGYINWSDMGQYAHYGFASMSTNTGHYSGALDATWALNKPESLVDWGHRAIHQSTVFSKEIVAAYYDTPSQYHYFSSCSNGGRQGLMELTAYPDDYDGIISGAPAWWMTHLFTWMAQIEKINAPDLPGHISDSLFQLINSEIKSQCSPQNGVNDGIIADPRRCHFVPEGLLCNATQALTGSECLTSPQISTLYHMLNDWVETNQTFVHPALDLGAEYVLGNPAGASYGFDFLRNMVYNSTSYGTADFDFLRTMQFADFVVGGTLNADFAVERFRARGGKIIQYHGLTDDLIPSGDSIYWHRKVQERLVSQGLSVDDWYRLFLVPGMNHCAASSSGAPWYFAAASHHSTVKGALYSTPGFADAKHDITLALLDWVEKGIPPAEIVATLYKNETVGLGVEKQRPLCPYPRSAVYSGKGDIDVAVNWACSS